MFGGKALGQVAGALIWMPGRTPCVGGGNGGGFVIFLRTTRALASDVRHPTSGGES